MMTMYSGADNISKACSVFTEGESWRKLESCKRVNYNNQDWLSEKLARMTVKTESEQIENFLELSDM